MPDFRFDMGNTNQGCVGMVAVITADDQKSAAERLQKLVGERTIEITFDDDDALQDGEYVNVYVNANNATMWDAEEEDHFGTIAAAKEEKEGGPRDGNPDT